MVFVCVEGNWSGIAMLQFRFDIDNAFENIYVHTDHRSELESVQMMYMYGMFMFNVPLHRDVFAFRTHETVVFIDMNVIPQQNTLRTGTRYEM